MSAEKIPHSTNHAEAIEQYFGANEQLLDPTQRRDYFEHLEGDDFIDLVQRTASLVRTGDSDSLQPFNGETVSLSTADVPDQREKEQLLRDTWDVAKSFLSNPNLPDDEALIYAALTMTGGLLYSHPFADGNGRTSRTLSYVMVRGTSNKNELRDVLAKSDGGGNWQVTPIPLTTSGKTEYDGKQPAVIEWESYMLDLGEDALGGAIAKSILQDRVIREFIDQYGALTEEQIDDSSTPNEDGGFTLVGEQFIKHLVADPEAGIANAKGLREAHRKVRAEFVHRFLRAMETDERIKPARIYPSDLEIREDDSTFVRNRSRIIIDELGKRSVDGMLTPAEQQLVQHRAYSRVYHHEK